MLARVLSERFQGFCSKLQPSTFLLGNNGMLRVRIFFLLMEQSRKGRHGLYDLNAALFMMCVQPPESRWQCSSFAWIIDSNVN